MRGMETGKTRIRHQVFTEIARMAYEGGDFAKTLEELPYKIIPGEIATYRDSIFVERAVVGERLRLALGMPLRSFSEYSKLSDGIVENELPEKYYEPPLINVVKFACNKCPDNVVTVTSGCQGCIEHPCMEVCPKKAIARVHGRAKIYPEKCIKCGRCAAECKFHAIIHQKRPCKQACGVDAIGIDEQGRAEINYDKCTSCGQCLVNCPFGAISDKSQIFQTITAIKSGTPVYIALAPSFVGQFGPDGTPEKMKAAFKHLGFAGVVEVAVGADLCVIEEANDYLDEVPGKHAFMVTSCCPSWSDMVKKAFPEFTDNISIALTPMVLTARMIKSDHPGCKVVFVGPCDAKKLEARRKSVRSEVDYVLTFEEVLGMFAARGVDREIIPEEETEPLNQASESGRNFAFSGGVAAAVVNAIQEKEPGREIKVAHADGLEECRKLLLMAKAGKYDGYLLEGMACPGGCVAGAGTLRPIDKTRQAVQNFAAGAEFHCAADTKFRKYLPLIEGKK
ncbi:MAG TPA: 4Fe-4S dicluster domain-containing protein [Oscillospiraceae bacterium]|nr:4Fe-4S dicluster domain-containing protein [Oscillospiraceae bacterium]